MHNYVGEEISPGSGLYRVVPDSKQYAPEQTVQDGGQYRLTLIGTLVWKKEN